MASAENTGLKVSLVVFVILWITFASLSYYFYNENTTNVQRAQEATKNEAAAKTAQAKSANDYKEFRSVVFGAATDTDHAAALNLVKAELGAPKINEIRKAQKPTYETYTGAIAYLHKELEESDKRITALQNEKAALEKTIEGVKQQYQTLVDTANTGRDAKTKELEEELAKFAQNTAMIQERLNQMQARTSELQSQADQVIKDSQAKEKRLTTTIKRLSEQIQDKRREETLEKAGLFSVADGQITSVDSSGTFAFINLGYQDGIRSGLSFAVYGTDQRGNPEVKPKATLDVLETLGPHRSKVTLHGQVITKPVMSGDRIHNPVWNPGQKESIAISGLVMMDYDDTPDNEQFKRIVQLAGGKIDAEADPKTGQVKGQITAKTGWLVIGDIPKASESGLNPELDRLSKRLQEADQILKKQADDNGVRVVSVLNFINYLGVNVPVDAVPAGSEYELLRTGGPRNRRPEEKGSVLERPKPATVAPAPKAAKKSG